VLSFLKTKQSCSKQSIIHLKVTCINLEAQCKTDLQKLRPTTTIDCYPKKNLAPQSLSSLSLSLKPCRSLQVLSETKLLFSEQEAEHKHSTAAAAATATAALH
jgi:hypothetical protein